MHACGRKDRTVGAWTAVERHRVAPHKACPMILVAVLLSLTACADDGGDSSVAPIDTSAGGTPTDTDTDTGPDVTLPPAQNDLDEALRQCAERANDATFTYQPNKQMTVGQPETVEAVAGASGVQPPDSLTGDEPTRTLSVSLACVVEASLVGPDFEIQPEGWQARSFLQSDVIRWVWQVEPERDGDALPLSLRLRAFVDAPGGGAPIPIGPDDTTVNISVDARPKSFGDRWSEIWSNPFWGSVSGLVIVVGAFAGVFRFIKKRWPWNRVPPSPPTT